MKKFFSLFFLLVFIKGLSTPFHLYIFNKNENIASYPGEKNVSLKKKISLKEKKKIKEQLLDKNLKAIIAPISFYEGLKKLLNREERAIELIFYYPRKKQNNEKLKKVLLKKKVRKQASNYPKEFSHLLFFSNHRFESKFLNKPFINLSLLSLDQNIEATKKIAASCDSNSILLLPDPFFLSKEVKKKIKLIEEQIFLSLKEKGIDSIYIKYYNDPKMMRSNFYQAPMLKLNTINLELKIVAEPGRYFYLINSKELLLSQELSSFQSLKPLHESTQLPASLL